MAQKVILDIVMSLDGYVASSDDTVDWLEGYDNMSEYGFDEFIAGVGAIIMGKRSYELGIHHGWFEGQPYGNSPIFVICHKKPSEVPEQYLNQFIFITDGIEAAFKAARVAAVGNNIYLFGGPSIIQQSLNLDLVDELRISIVPIILGKGIPLFNNLDERQIRLELLENKVFSKGLTALYYKVLKP